MTTVRKATNRILELTEQGVLSWKSVANACLRYMSEYEVADMAHDNGWLEDEEEEQEEDTNETNE